MPEYTHDDLMKIFRAKYGEPENCGWSPRLRFRFHYFNPDDIYEAVLSEFVTEATTWLDVGCGRDIFPSNFQTAKVLASRCLLLVGLDPSDNIFGNPLLHERVKGLIDDFHTDRQFDLITLRMVAEHITDPERAVAALTRLVRLGGCVVVYTVFKWSPVTLVSAASPLGLHQAVKRAIWGTEEKDTFPTTYRMNTRSALARLFGSAGFTEESFQYLDDCRTFSKWKWLNTLELLTWKALRWVGLHYPEVCLLGVYRKN